MHSSHYFQDSDLEVEITVHQWNQLLATACSCGLVAHLATSSIQDCFQQILTWSEHNNMTGQFAEN